MSINNMFKEIESYVSESKHRANIAKRLRKPKVYRNRAKSAVGFKFTHYEKDGIKYFKQNGSWFKVPLDNSAAPVKITRKDLPRKMQDIIGTAKVGNGPTVQMRITDTHNDKIDTTNNNTLNRSVSDRAGVTHVISGKPNYIKINKSNIKKRGSDVATSHEYGHANDINGDGTMKSNNPEFQKGVTNAYVQTKNNLTDDEKSLIPEPKKKVKNPERAANFERMDASRTLKFLRDDEAYADKFGTNNIQDKHDSKDSRIDRHADYLKSISHDGINLIHQLKGDTKSNLNNKRTEANNTIELRKKFNKELTK